VPFLGQYFDLTPERAAEVRGLIYPVPDPRLPFLGVHLTRRMPSPEHPQGSVDAGPNAVLSLSREGYGSRLPSLRDAASALTWPGTWRLIARHGGHASAELAGSFSRRAFARRAARLLPGLGPEHLVPRPPGIRAQALGKDGGLIDDYAFVRRGPTLHLLNAPSPAATSCLAIADELRLRLEAT
jgi:L-2-hydroxyglutarate oxidase